MIEKSEEIIISTPWQKDKQLNKCLQFIYNLSLVLVPILFKPYVCI